MKKEIWKTPEVCTSLLRFQKLVVTLDGVFSDSKNIEYFISCSEKQDRQIFRYEAIWNGDEENEYSVATEISEGGYIEDALVMLTVPLGEGSYTLSWEKATETYADISRIEIRNAIEKMIENGTLTDVNSDGVIVVSNYDREEWKFGKDDLTEILSSEDPSTAYEEKLDEFARRYLYDRCIEMNIVDKEIRQQLDGAAEVAAKFFDDVLEDEISESIGIKYDENDWNQMLKVNLMVDSGNWSYSLCCDDLLSGEQPKERLEHSSIVYVAELLGKRKELYSALAGAEEEKADPFISSIYKELENNPYPNGSTMTFLVELPLRTLLDILYNQRLSKEVGSKPMEIAIPKDTMCGLFNAWNGSGSLLEVKLPRDISIPVDKLEFQVEGANIYYRYSVDEVYGLVSSAWTLASWEGEVA